MTRPIVRDLADERQQQLIQMARVYVDSEGRPWRKTERGEYVRIPVERKPD